MSPDAIVIGAGVVGAAVAAELARAGMRVQILETAFPAGGTTSAAMGHIVVMDDSPAQLALTAYSSRLLHDALSGSSTVDHHRCGTLWIAENEDQLDAAHHKADTLNAGGVRAEVIDDRALHNAEPALRPGLAGAVYVLQDVVVYPPSLCAWLLRIATEHGAEIRPRTEVLRAEPHAVVTGQGRLNADVIVNAAGVRAPDITPGLPIVPRRGHLVVTEPGTPLCRHQLVELGYMQSAHDMSAGSVAFNVQPRPAGQLLIGSSRDLAGHTTTIDRSIVARMLARAIEFLPPLRRMRALRTWAGLRPATADGLPFIGQWERTPGLWIAAGHEGLGITTALGTASLLVDMVRGVAPAIDPLPYSPARAAVSISA